MIIHVHRWEQDSRQRRKLLDQVKGKGPLQLKIETVSTPASSIPGIYPNLNPNHRVTDAHTGTEIEPKFFKLYSEDPERDRKMQEIEDLQNRIDMTTKLLARAMVSTGIALKKDKKKRRESGPASESSSEAVGGGGDKSRARGKGRVRVSGDEVCLAAVALVLFGNTKTALPGGYAGDELSPQSPIVQVEQFPSEFILLARATVLLRGLSKELGFSWSLAARWFSNAVEAAGVLDPQWEAREREFIDRELELSTGGKDRGAVGAVGASKGKGVVKKAVEDAAAGVGTGVGTGVGAGVGIGKAHPSEFMPSWAVSKVTVPSTDQVVGEGIIGFRAVAGARLRIRDVCLFLLLLLLLLSLD